MSIPLPSLPARVRLASFAYNFPNWSNTTPFTYQDGQTNAKLVESIVAYIDQTLVPYVDTHMTEVTDGWKESVTLILTNVDDAITDNNAEIDAKIAVLELYVNTKVQEILDGSIEIQDPLVAQLIANTGSATRTAGDLVWSKKSTETDVAALQALTETGRLSSTSLNARFDEVGNDLTAIDAAIALKADLTALNALATVVDTKASSASVANVAADVEATNARIVAGAYAGVLAKFGGPPVDSKFDFLRAGIVTPSQDTRVVVLGSSNANAHVNTSFVTKTDKACFQRLSYRANAGPQKALDTVSGPISPSGMSWYNGAEGNTTSANYFPTARRTKLGYVAPRYVIHQVGENDYFYGTPIATYKANIKSACEFVEAANPAAINILIHGHGRTDAVSPVAPWDSYGQALRELQAELPGRRFFIDLSQYFTARGSMSGDYNDLLLDGVHLNDNGNRFEANILSAYLGIPSESDVVGENTYDFPLSPTNITYTAAGETMAEVWFTAVNYPREVEIIGSIWGNFSNAAGYYTIAAVDTGAVSLDYIGLTPGTGPVSQPIAARLYIPPMKAGSVKIVDWPAPGNNAVQGTTGGLTRVKAVFKPV